MVPAMENPNQPDPNVQVPNLDDPERTQIRQRDVTNLTPGSDIQSLVGSLLDHYKIESLVGQGGMGAVFRAIDQRLDRVVAIKVVPILHRKNDALRRFRIEAQSAAKLDHPNIARVYNVGETNQWNYIVFEFIEGINLRQLVLDRGPLSVDDATYFTCQVAGALQHASDRGVVHRDIKPSNILLASDGKAKIVDMGLARTTALDRSQGDQTASGTTLGTFDYISPEQAHDPREADVRSDIYSLGCTLYYLLTGQPPFPEGTALQKLLMHGSRMPEDPRLFRDDLSDPLIEILKKMMAKKPRDRYQTPEDLASDLRMLAKIDNLAWSSDLAEFALATAQSKRTWLEFTLPMALCSTLIGATTLWLVSANQVDAVFPIPKVEIASVSNEPTPEISSKKEIQQGEFTPPTLSQTISTKDELNSNSNESSEPNPDQTLESRTKTHQLVVIDNANASIDLPLAPDELKIKSFKTLDEALIEAASLNAACKIWVAQNCTLQKRWRSMSTQRPESLQIQSIPGKRFSIRIDEPSISGNSGEYLGCFELDGNQLHLADLDILWNSPINNSTSKSFVLAKPGSRLLIENSTVTINGPISAGTPTLVAIDPLSRDLPNGTTSINNPRFSEVRIERSCIRGQCDLIQANPSDRLELKVRDSWFALAGSMLVSQGNKTMNRSPRIRVEIADSTCISLKPWLRVELSNATPYPIAVVRISNQSIFAGAKSLVQWDATDCTDWVFSNQVKKLEDLGRWIDFRGLDNAYDSESIDELVRVQMSMSSQELQIDADSNLLRNELGMEVISLWQQRSSWEPASMHLAIPLTIPPGTLGFQIGAPTEKLPILPSI
jgi:serine/threonine protein kinase